jgi:hypothetical protein
MKVGNLGESIETILGKNYLMTRLLKKYFGAAPDGVAVVNHHDSKIARRLSHNAPSL